MFVVTRDWSAAIELGLYRQLIGFTLTLGLWRIFRSWPIDQLRVARHGWKVLAICLVVAAVDVLLTDAVRRAVEIAGSQFVLTLPSYLIRLALYFLWALCYFGIRQEIFSRETARRLAQFDAAQRESELHLLRAQMNPHFIFNALGHIINEAEENNQTGVIKITHAIADYLRYSLSQTNHLAPLGHELNAMANYLEVETNARGSDRIQWRIDASDEARLALAPTAFVQPLIENAIKYGNASSVDPLQITVEARIENRNLLIAVENTGVWIPPRDEHKPRSSHGIGLTNLRRRLALLCGEGVELHVTPLPSRVRVWTEIPPLFVPTPAPVSPPALSRSSQTLASPIPAPPQ
jgi:hypothetical protein